MVLEGKELQGVEKLGEGSENETKKSRWLEIGEGASLRMARATHRNTHCLEGKER